MILFYRRNRGDGINTPGASGDNLSNSFREKPLAYRINEVLTIDKYIIFLVVSTTEREMLFKTCSKYRA